MYTHRRGCTPRQVGVVSPAQQPSNVRASREEARNGRGPAGAGGRRGRAAAGGRGEVGVRSLPASPATLSGPSSARAKFERADYSSPLRVQPTAIQVNRQGNRCNYCANASRTSTISFGNVPFRNAVKVSGAVTVRPSAPSRLFPNDGLAGVFERGGVQRWSW